MPLIEEEELLDILGEIQASQLLSGSIFSHIETVQPKKRLSDIHFGTLSLVAESCDQVFDAILLPEEMASMLRSTIASLARVALRDGLVILSRQNAVLSIVDNLILFCIGVTDASDRIVHAIRDKVVLSLNSLQLLMGSAASTDTATREHLMSLLANEIEGHIQDELVRVDKLEQRLIETETGLLKAGRSKNIAAKTLNAKMENQSVPVDISNFLEGAWFESLQLILTNKGIDSEAWAKATKTTEKLIWSMQSSNFFVESSDDQEKNIFLKGDAAGDPERKGSQAFYETVETLAHDIEQLLVSLEHDRNASRKQLAEIESIHVAIMSGEQPAYQDWTPLKVDEVLGNTTAVSKDLVNQVESLDLGQWFVFLGGEGPARHIKLVLKMDDLQQLLFTNRNGQKALQPTFDEFAYYLTSATTQPLPPPHAIGRNLRRQMNKLVSSQLKKEPCALWPFFKTSRRFKKPIGDMKSLNLADKPPQQFI